MSGENVLPDMLRECPVLGNLSHAIVPYELGISSWEKTFLKWEIRRHIWVEVISFCLKNPAAPSEHSPLSEPVCPMSFHHGWGNVLIVETTGAFRFPV